MKINNRLTKSAITLGDFPTGGSIGTAPNTVDIVSHIRIGQTTAGQTLTLPVPSVPDNGVELVIYNSGKVPFTMLGEIVSARQSLTAMLEGGVWTIPTTTEINLSRTLPIVVNNYIEIGNFTENVGAHNLRISAIVGDGGFVVSKQYMYPANWHNTAGAWRVLTPTVDSGAYNGLQDFELLVNQNNATLQLRVRRNLGTLPGTVKIKIELMGDPATIFTPTTATGTDATVYTSKTYLNDYWNTSAVLDTAVAAYTVLATDQVINLTLAGAQTLTLPAVATSTKRILQITNPTATAKTVSTYTTISGSTSTTVPANSTITIQSNGAIWRQISGGGAGSPTVNAQTGTTYTTVAGDSNNIVTLNNAAAIALTLSNLTAGSTTTFIQLGAGIITFTTGTLTRRHVTGTAFRSAGQYSIVSATVVGTDAVLSGDVQV